MRRYWMWILLAVLVFDAVLAFWWYARNGERRYYRAIHIASRQYHVDPALVKAVIWRESGFDPDARGGAGELGLMQVRHLAASEWAEAEQIREFSHESLIDPSRNTLAGTWYLAKLLKRYPQTDDPLPYALADYNAGRTHVLRWMKESGKTNSAIFQAQIDFPGTKRYIATVLKRYHRYRSQ